MTFTFIFGYFLLKLSDGRPRMIVKLVQQFKLVELVAPQIIKI